MLILIYLLTVFLPFTCNAQKQMTDISNIKNKILDIPYATVSDAQKLDIYVPEDHNGPFPVILAIHGGGFRGGDKRELLLKDILNGLNNGFAVVSINYRLSGEAIWPAQIYDCKAAVRWIRANSEHYNLNGKKIVAWGGSAGGHLAAMLGTSGDVKALEDLSLGNPDQSSRVQVVVDFFGPTDFLKMDDQAAESGVKKPMKHLIAGTPEFQLAGGNLSNMPEKAKSLNPETYISPDDPPFFIQHGIEDNLVPYQASVNLARKLGNALGYEKVFIQLFSSSGHGGPVFGTEKNINKIFEFIDMWLTNE